jgi:hypothetical protein
VPNFFLWRYLKSKVYVSEPDAVMELKEHIAVGMKVTDATLL